MKALEASREYQEALLRRVSALKFKSKKSAGAMAPSLGQEDEYSSETASSVDLTETADAFPEGDPVVLGLEAITQLNQTCLPSECVNKDRRVIQVSAIS